MMPEPALATAKFIGPRARPDGIAIARLTGTALEPAAIQGCAISPGFFADLVPQRRSYDRAVIVGLQIERRDPTAGHACVVRFSCGPASIHATIDVP